MKQLKTKQLYLGKNLLTGDANGLYYNGVRLWAAGDTVSNSEGLNLTGDQTYSGNLTVEDGFRVFSPSGYQLLSASGAQGLLNGQFGQATVDWWNKQLIGAPEFLGDPFVMPMMAWDSGILYMPVVDISENLAYSPAIDWLKGVAYSYNPGEVNPMPRSIDWSGRTLYTESDDKLFSWSENESALYRPGGYITPVMSWSISNGPDIYRDDQYAMRASYSTLMRGGKDRLNWDAGELYYPGFDHAFNEVNYIKASWNTEKLFTDWQDELASLYGNEISLDWGERQLYSFNQTTYASSTSVDWQNRQLRSTGSIMMDWNGPIALNGQVNVNNGALTVASGGTQFLSTANRTLAGYTGTVAEWGNRRLRRDVLNTDVSASNYTLDWHNRQLSGQWVTNASPTVSNHIINKGYLDTRLASLATDVQGMYVSTDVTHTTNSSPVTLNEIYVDIPAGETWAGEFMLKLVSVSNTTVYIGVTTAGTVSSSSFYKVYSNTSANPHNAIGGLTSQSLTTASEELVLVKFSITASTASTVYVHLASDASNFDIKASSTVVAWKIS